MRGPAHSFLIKSSVGAAAKSQVQELFDGLGGVIDECSRAILELAR
jgi:hypothetical protein